MTLSRHHRRHLGNGLGMAASAIAFALLLIPASAMGMQKIPDSTVEPTPLVVDADLRDAVDILPGGTTGQDSGTEVSESPSGAGGTLTNASYGYTVEYPAPWRHAGTYDEEGITTEYLEIRGEPGGIYVTGYEWTGEYTVREYIEWWATPEYSQEWLPGGERIRYVTSASRGAVVHISEPTEEYPEPWVYVTELHAYDGYAVEIVHFAPISTFADSYTSVEGALLVEDAPVLGTFPYDEIEAMLPAE